MQLDSLGGAKGAHHGLSPLRLTVDLEKSCAVSDQNGFCTANGLEKVDLFKYSSITSQLNQSKIQTSSI